MMIKNTVLVLALFAISTLTYSQQNDHIFPSAPSAKKYIDFDRQGFIINGKKTFLVSAGLEYARIPHQLWRDRLLRLKRAGFNCIEIYTFWNFHEPHEGQFDFSGDHDLDAFLRLVRRLGMYATVRAGPYYCAEWNFGGYPIWLKFKGNFKVRNPDADFEKYADRFFDTLIPIVSRNQINHGGAVILVQLENEHDAGWGTLMPNSYFTHLQQKALSLGIEVPYFFSGLHHGGDPAGNGTRAFDDPGRPNPWYTTEFWTVWYNYYGSNQKDADQFGRRTWKIIEHGGGGYNYYMAHGGTNFGYTNSDEDAASYDYGAAVGQTGDLRPIYYQFKRNALFARSFENILCNATDASGAYKGFGGNKAVQVYARHSVNGDIVFLDNAGPKEETIDSLHLTLAPGEILPIVKDVHLTGSVILNHAFTRILGVCRQGDITTLVVYGPAGSTGELQFSSPGKLVLHVNYKAGEPTVYQFRNGSRTIRIIALDPTLADRTWFVGNQYVVAGPEYLGDIGTHNGRLRLTTEHFWAQPKIFPTYVYTASGMLMSPAKAAIASHHDELAIGGWETRDAAAPAKAPAVSATVISQGEWFTNDTSGAAPQMGADGDLSCYAWYTTTAKVNSAGNYRLCVHHGGDRAIVFIDGIRKGSGKIPGDIRLKDLTPGDHSFAVFTAHDGRNKLYNYYGPIDSKDAKGLSGNVFLQKYALSALAAENIDSTPMLLKGWRLKGGPGDAVTATGWMPPDANDTFDRPHFYRSQFIVPKTDSSIHAMWRVSFAGLGHGSIWVNGHNLGRYPEKIPINSLYIPECWLVPGNNSLVVFDGDGKRPDSIRIRAEEASSRDEDHQDLTTVAAIGQRQMSPRPKAQRQQPMTDIRSLLDACNVVWDVPGPTSAGSMPIGNGDIGLNVWVTPTGELNFYIAKTDAWGPDIKGGKGLMKVGGVRVALNPNPLTSGASFTQTLRLNEGEIDVKEGDVQLRVWVDANNPVIHVETTSKTPVTATVTLNDWRLHYANTNDTLISGKNDIAWYHRNPVTAEKHVAGLTFGAVIKGKGLVTKDDTTLESGAGISHVMSIYPYTAQTTMAGWRMRLDKNIAAIDKLPLGQARVAHRKWWNSFWRRSWIFFSGTDENAAKINQGYVLQNFITACGGRGAYPIKFNGSIFTVDNPHLIEVGSKKEISVDPDYRTWGGQYWFQNTRAMYWPMLEAGNFDMMMPLFKMYYREAMDNKPLIEGFYHHDGSYFAETAPFYGGVRYMGPEVKEDWTGHYFTPILECSMMMLDYYEFTGDKKFAKEILVPVATAGLEFYDKHFKRDTQGKLLLDPDNAIEQYWKVHDPAPDIAGLMAVTTRMLALPEELTTSVSRRNWTRLRSELPDLPKGIRNGKEVLFPYSTDTLSAKPRNNENPGLYAIYPFRLYELGKPDLQLAINSFDLRLKHTQKGCWVQDPIQAAMLGLTDVAQDYTSFNLQRKDAQFKFPAFWQEANDYAPDEDNGGNGQNGLQTMLMLTEGKKIMLLPAWPKNWGNVNFKLHAPYNTTVEGSVVNGQLMNLVVTPASRRADVVDMSDPGVASGQRLTSYVDPMIGAGGHGHVFVGASVPFGAVQLGPENFYKGWDWCSGYHYGDSILIGFAHTHLSGTGIGDLGDVLIMPYTGQVKTDKGKETIPGSGYASHYSHRNEIVKPGYYSVKLDDYGIRVELTATERVGFHRYHFPAGKAAHVIIDLKEGINDRATDTYIGQVDDSTFEGRRYSRGWAKNQWLYFAIRTSVPIHHFSVYNGDTLQPGTKAQGNSIKGLISFDKAPSTLLLKVGISPVSGSNALGNIMAEIPGWDFNAIAQRADDKWNTELSRIRVETKNAGDKKIFYTALFHTMIDPMLFNDHNGDYRGADKQVYHHASFQNYTVFSLWDTYRALNPLYTLIQPDRVDDIVNSLLAIYQQQGKLPVWHLEGCETNTMPGLSSVQVVAEAYMKGFNRFDKDLAFTAMDSSMLRQDRGLGYDQKDQFIPSDKLGESVAMGLEYAVSSASIALVAKRQGRREDASRYEQRSNNYRLYYDSVTGFFRGKKSDGSWNMPFDPARSSRPWINDLSEGNHWQYLWLVPEHVEGLIHLLGGEQTFVKRLDSLFTIPVLPDPNAPPDIAGLIGQYAHGDEPGHQTIYLYAYAGQQWKSAEKARFIMQNMYPDNIDGLSGNEDCGQMSAWYIFSALGFYPVFPANGGYVLGSPLFDKATIGLPGGKTFTVEAVNNSRDNKYIQSVEWNGKKYDKSYILHKDIVAGGTLKIYMGSRPNKQFGSNPDDRPRSIYP